MMNITLPILCLLCLTPAFAGERDTISNCQSASGFWYYRDPMIVMQAARFELAAPGHVTEIILTMGGEQPGTAVVHLYGREGGANAPLLEKDLMTPIRITKTERGLQTIHVVPPNPVFIGSNQLFIAVDSLSPGVTLLSDRRSNQPFCSAAPDYYYYQFLKLSNNRWQWGAYSYAIDLVVEYPGTTVPSYLNDVTADMMPTAQPATNKSIAWTDINSDGYLDLMIGGTLYANHHGAGFRDITLSAGLQGTPRANAFIDIDNNGRTDILFIGFHDSTNSTGRLFVNAGDGTFTERPIDLPGIIDPTSFSIVDINSDGYPDIFIGQSESPGALFINDHGAQFINASGMLAADGDSIAPSRGSQWVDADGDRKIDLFVATERSPFGELWHNRGNGVFINNWEGADATAGTERHAGCHWADYDNDGDMDLFLPAAAGSPLTPSPEGSRIVTNRGRGPEPDASPSTTIEYEMKHTGGAWGDVDNDGLLDFVVTTACGCRYADLYIQKSGNHFEQGTYEYGLQRVAAGDDAVWVDFDNDGRLDLSTISDGHIRLFRNTSPTANNYLELDITGTDADGAIVTLHAGDNVYTRQTTSGRGLLMQDPFRLHFGLGGAAEVDSAVVRWSNGTIRSFTGLRINTIHTINNNGLNTLRDGMATVSVSPNPFSDNLHIIYTLPFDQHITLAIYTVDGTKVRTLIDRAERAGEHSILWNGEDADGGKAPQGAYVYRLTIKEAELTGRIVLAR